MKKKQFNWNKFLKIFVILVFGIIGIKICLSFSVTFFGGPANHQIREDVTYTMKNIFKDHDFNGELSVKKVNHVGFSQGGIVVDYSYSEDVNGKPVTLTEQMNGFDDRGKLNDTLSDSDYGGEFVQFVKKSSLQQPYYSKTSKVIYSELKKQETSNFKLDRKPENSVEPELIYFEENSTLTSLQWYKQQVNNNKISKDKNRQAFGGYYSISPQQALAKGAVYYRINFIYNVTGKENKQTDIKGRKILDHLLLKINSKKFPDGKYMIGFYVKDKEGIKGDITNLKYIQMKNGKITAQSPYGEAQIIEYWNE